MTELVPQGQCLKSTTKGISFSSMANSSSQHRRGSPSQAFLEPVSSQPHGSLLDHKEVDGRVGSARQIAQVNIEGGSPSQAGPIAQVNIDGDLLLKHFGTGFISTARQSSRSQRSRWQSWFRKANSSSQHRRGSPSQAWQIAQANIDGDLLLKHFGTGCTPCRLGA